MHLDGFIIRIYHDARSPDRQIYYYINFFGQWIKGFNMLYLGITVIFHGFASLVSNNKGLPALHNWQSYT